MSPSQRLTVVALGALIAVGVGCGPESTQPSHSHPQLQPITVPHRAHFTAQFCPDVTSSTSERLTQHAEHLVADAVDASATVNQEGAVVYVNLINHESYDPSATQMVISVPALPPDPLPPAEPAAPHSANPFTAAQERAGQQKAYAQQLQTYQTDLAHRHARLAEVRGQVRRQTDQLRNLREPRDPIATSIYGCLLRAAERLTEVSGERYLVLQTDLLNNTARDLAPVRDLDGVHVKLIDFECSVGSECEARMAAWRRLFFAAGARTVSFYDPAQTTTLDPASLFSPPVT